MRDEGDEAGGRLWTRGEMTFQVGGAGRESDRVVEVRRPYALLGQTSDIDITIRDPAVSARHVYLHLDPRGVYAVDLITRTGTRLNGTNQAVGWLRPGDWLEVGGRRVELLRSRVDGISHDPPPCDTNLLADTGRTTLVGVSLEPRRSAGRPWVIGSELVFLGWSAACGIQVNDRAVARTHCALLRTATAAYVVDLSGQHTWIDDRPLRGASIVHDGQILTLGTVSYIVRVEPAATNGLVLEALSFEAGRPESLARLDKSELSNGTGVYPPLELIPPESQQAILAWMMGTIQGSQGETLRQQGDFQLAITRLLHQIQQDNATLLESHLSQIENVDRELASLRVELERRETLPPMEPQAALPPPPPVTPLRIPRTIPDATGTQTSTTWLLRRVSQLENENRSAWREFLGRLAFVPRRDP